MSIILKITRQAYNEMSAYIKYAKDEISGLGEVKKNGNCFTVEKIHLFKQIVTSCSTDLSGDAVHEMLYAALAGNVEPANLRLWWHSHVNMSTFWSGTDTATINEFSAPWMISIVGNKKGSMLCRFDLYEPIRLNIDEIPLQIEEKVDPELEARVREEIATKVFYPPPLPGLDCVHVPLLRPWPHGNHGQKGKKRE